MTGSSRRAALAVLCTGMLMIILDGTIVTVALPSIQADLGFSASGLAWVVNGYLVAFGGLLLLAGRLGDLLGRRRTFLAGLAVFTAASIACGFSMNPALLVVARFVQGAGGAAASAVVLGMVVTLFPAAAERARAIGVVTFVGAAGASIGLVTGGVITEALDWRWVFLINAPIGVVALAAAARVLPRDRGLGLAAGADVPGAGLVTAGLMLGVTTIVQAPGQGWTSARTLGSAALAVLLLAGFVLRQARVARPLLPLRIFRSRAVSGANGAQVLMVAAALGFQFLSALYLQQVLGYGPARTGFAVVPVAVGIGILSLGPAGRLARRYGSRPVLLTGLALLAAGMAVLARLPVDARYAVDLLPALLLLGAGAGLALPTITALAMSDATEADAGLASGLANTSQQVGGALGISVLAAVAAARADALGTGAAALAGGFRVAFAVAAGLAVAALVVTALVLRPAPVRAEA
ncbi:MAG TPA: MFS transporter [Mycobacteriales bacterium]|nr:MFS transporter [Mycobacteriales bacterium]